LSAWSCQRRNYSRCLQYVLICHTQFFKFKSLSQYNKYKVHLIQSKIPDGSSTTVYRCGPMVDLCLGPHVPNTSRIKAFMVTKVNSSLSPAPASWMKRIVQNSASYFLGDANNDSLQRIYGISFPDKKQLTEYKNFIAEAAKRDHRKIGTDQELFFFDSVSPGSCFFLPHGTRIYNALIELIRVGCLASAPDLMGLTSARSLTISREVIRKVT
jgi:threonyl-tRNA synthetase